MYLNQLMNEKHMSRAQLGSVSGIPESTLRDILNGKTRLDHCEALTLLTLADALDTTVEDIIEHYWEEVTDAEPEWDEPELITVHDEDALANFYMLAEKTLSSLRCVSDMRFICTVCDGYWIESFFAVHSYRMALFLLALIDYLGRKHYLKPDPRFDKFRSYRLDQPVFSLATLEKSDDNSAFVQAKVYAESVAIPEFARFNILMTGPDICTVK